MCISTYSQHITYPLYNLQLRIFLGFKVMSGRPLLFDLLEEKPKTPKNIIKGLKVPQFELWKE